MSFKKPHLEVKIYFCIKGFDTYARTKNRGLGQLKRATLSISDNYMALWFQVLCKLIT